MRPAWVARAAPDDVQYERGAGARMASDGMAFNKVVKTGMRWSGFPPLPVLYIQCTQTTMKKDIIDTLTIENDVFRRRSRVAPAQQ